MLKFLLTSVIEEAVAWFIKEMIFQYKLEFSKKKGIFE